MNATLSAGDKALALTCAKLVSRAYGSGFLDNPYTLDLSDMGRVVEWVIWGCDAGVGSVPYGFISSGPMGPIAAFRGTEMPKGSLEEWRRNFDAYLERCPLVPGACWHDGFGSDFRGLSASKLVLDKTLMPLAATLHGFPGLICTGHSKGAPLATYAGLVGFAERLVLFASPKAGDKALADHVGSVFKNTLSFANPNDEVPKLPLTLPDPLGLFNFHQVSDLLTLDPSLVRPPVAPDWYESHILGNYQKLLEAA